MKEAGLIALGAASIYGGAGYLFAIAISEWDATAVEALLVSFLIMIAYASILGALIVRTNPLAFMMLTLAAGEMISHSVMLEGLRDYTGGADGLVVSFKDSILGMGAADFASAARFWPVACSAAWLAASWEIPLTSAPLCTIARLNSPCAAGMAISELTLPPPPDWPKMVTLPESPPKAPALSRTHSSAATISSMPTLLAFAYFSPPIPAKYK